MLSDERIHLLLLLLLSLLVLSDVSRLSSSSGGGGGGCGVIIVVIVSVNVLDREPHAQTTLFCDDFFHVGVELLDRLAADDSCRRDKCDDSGFRGFEKDEKAALRSSKIVIFVKFKKTIKIYSEISFSFYNLIGTFCCVKLTKAKAVLLSFQVKAHMKRQEQLNFND